MMTSRSIKVGFSILFVLIVVRDCETGSRRLQKKPTILDILKRIKQLPSSLTQIERNPSQLGDLLDYLELWAVEKNVTVQQNRFNQQANYINNRYERLASLKESSKDEETRVMELSKFANQSISGGSNDVSRRLDEFIETIVISNNDQLEGLLHVYLKHMNTLNEKNRWCVEGQSISYFIYNSFRYTLDIVRRGYSIILQSYAVLQAFGENVNERIHLIEKMYESNAKKITDTFRGLAIAAPTRMARCDPWYQVRSGTYLEMEKLLQGILPQEATLNEGNSVRGTCEDHNQEGTIHYEYGGSKHDGDWKCHGLLYDCFRISSWIDICKPLSPNRRMDGFLEIACYSKGCFRAWPLQGMGHLEQCLKYNMWELYEWRYYRPISLYAMEQCACICDDLEHPNTLRKFSREFAMSDYKNNMVVTGVRLVNISNVIHIQIQEGKLEKYGFINSSTVQWRLKNNIANRSEDHGSHLGEVVTLSYHKRRVTLDVFQFFSNEVILGATFDWDREQQGLVLSVFVTVFSYATGELNQEYRMCHYPTQWREEIVLDHPHLPTLCSENFRVPGDDKFIRFQTTDWKKDAAQTTIPYLDIQEVVTNPPTMLRGLGLYYKNAPGCGGYIGLELYSHDYHNFIFYNETLH